MLGFYYEPIINKQDYKKLEKSMKTIKKESTKYERLENSYNKYFEDIYVLVSISKCIVIFMYKICV